MIYEMWNRGEEKPSDIPAGCQFCSSMSGTWTAEHDPVEAWSSTMRRWPAQEQRPTAYGLMTDEEQVEVLKAFHHGRLEYLTENGWIKKTAGTCLFNGSTYRIKPEPTVEIIVKVNGKLTDPCTLSKESWAALRKEN